MQKQCQESGISLAGRVNRRPCKGCTKRYPACQDVCPDHAARKAYDDAIRAERQRQYGGEAAEYERQSYETRKNWRRY